jgi:outer membrane protein assembly factor BamB
MLGAALALLLGAAAAVDGRLPPAPRSLYRVTWLRPLASTPLLEWRPDEPGGAAFDPISRIAVAGTRDGWLHGLRPDGSVAWTFRGGGAFAAEPVIEGDTVYAGCNDGRLYALAVASGKERWRYEAREQLGTRPLVVGGLVYVASLQDTLFAVDARTGAWRWHHRREGKEGFNIRGAAPAVAAKGLVYGSFSDGTVAALDAATGVVRWERRGPTGGPYTDVDSLVLSDGRLFAGAYGGAVVALDAATGRPLWQHLAPEVTRLALAPGTLVAVTTSSVLALSPSDGKVAWEVPLNGSPGGNPLAVGRWLLVPAGEGGLRGLELASGRTVRVMNPGSGVSATPALAGRRILVLSSAGRLLALDLR